jgi:hypothetical protein
LISFHRRWPAPLAAAALACLNLAGLLQPVDIAPLCPWLVLRMER